MQLLGRLPKAAKVTVWMFNPLYIHLTSAWARRTCSRLLPGQATAATNADLYLYGREVYVRLVAAA